MQKNLYIITKKDLFDLFARLTARYAVFVPYGKGEGFYFDVFDPSREDRIELCGIRQDQPLKSFLSLPRETVINSVSKNSKPVIIAGVKGCDLSSLALQDYVFRQGECEDPAYANRREMTILFGSDCTYAKETCFCLAMNGAPYPRAYFDLNFSLIDNHYLVEVVSAKGEGIINDFKMFFKEAANRDIALRQTNREKVAEQVSDFIARRGTPDATRIKGAVKKSYYTTALWEDEASTCVECGACNLVCPTCHCFLLCDEKSGAATRRNRIWDACLYKSFARVAGNANPRKHLYERLRNRFDKKFSFFPEVMDYVACTGCGRCIDACPGDIDIREVLKGLVSGTWSRPPHE